MRNPPVILLVEDNADDVLLIQRAFRKVGGSATIETVSDGEAAVAHLSSRLQDSTGLPSLVLLDLKLPLRSGLEVLQWLRAQPGLRSLPVVVLTSSREGLDLRRAYDFGANSYLVKPISFSDMQTMAGALETYWIGLNQRP